MPLHCENLVLRRFPGMHVDIVRDIYRSNLTDRVEVCRDQPRLGIQRTSRHLTMGALRSPTADCGMLLTFKFLENIVCCAEDCVSREVQLFGGAEKVDDSRAARLGSVVQEGGNSIVEFFGDLLLLLLREGIIANTHDRELVAQISIRNVLGWSLT